MTPQSGIYSICCIPTGEKYIGSTNNFDKRWSEHVRRLNGHRHTNYRLRMLWWKYGAQAFVFTEIEIVEDKGKLFEREQHYLDTLKPALNIILIAEGSSGMTGRHHSEETKRKMSESSKGQIVSDEQRRKLSEANKGKKLPAEVVQKMIASRAWYKHSDTTKEKMSQAALGRKVSAEGRANMSKARKGVPLSEAHRAKLSEVRKGRKHKPHSDETKRKIGERQREYQARKRAERE